MNNENIISEKVFSRLYEIAEELKEIKDKYDLQDIEIRCYEVNLPRITNEHVEINVAGGGFKSCGTWLMYKNRRINKKTSYKILTKQPYVL